MTPPDTLTLRRHYLTIAREHIARQIAELRERATDLEVEIIRANREGERDEQNGHRRDRIS
jgi:hypothetical protein